MTSAEIKKQIQQVETHSQMLNNSIKNNEIMLAQLQVQLENALRCEAKKHA